MSEKQPTIAYIMGPGRSGTTILSVLLENSPGIVSAGEVIHFFQDGYINNNVCACGETIGQCDFWGPVVKALDMSQQGAEDVADMLKQLDWHSGLKKAYSHTQPEQLWQKYQKLNLSLFSTIQQTQNCQLIVDSSKYAARALNLQRTYPDNVKVICILRSPEGLIHSFIKPNKDEQRPKSLVKIVVYYYLVLWSLFLANKRLKDDVIVINYEDLIEDPITVLTALEKFLAMDLSVSKAKVTSGAVLDIGHFVTGNRLRKNKSLTFKQGTASKVKLTFTQKIALFFMHIWRSILGMNHVG